MSSDIFSSIGNLFGSSGSSALSIGDPLPPIDLSGVTIPDSSMLQPLTDAQLSQIGDATIAGGAAAATSDPFAGFDQSSVAGAGETGGTPDATIGSTDNFGNVQANGPSAGSFGANDRGLGTSATAGDQGTLSSSQISQLGNQGGTGFKWFADLPQEAQKAVWGGIGMGAKAALGMFANPNKDARYLSTKYATDEQAREFNINQANVIRRGQIPNAFIAQHPGIINSATGDTGNTGVVSSAPVQPGQ